MSPHKILSAKHLSPYELPILPFLAPRVFKTWPRSCRSHTTAAAKKATVHDVKIENLPPSHKNHYYEAANTQLLRGRIAHMGDKTEIQPSRVPHTRTGRDGPHIGHNPFLRAYEDIWGSRRA